MVTLYDIENIKANRITVYVFFSLSLILPGNAYLFVFFRYLFLSLPLTKLLIVSLFFTVPIFIINLFFVSLFNSSMNEVIIILSNLDKISLKKLEQYKIIKQDFKSKESPEEDILQVYFLSSIITTLIFFIPLIMKLLLRFPNTFIQLFIFIGILQLLIVIMMICLLFYIEKIKELINTNL